MNKVKPVSPKDVEKAKVIPDEVILAFNNLLAKYFNGGEAVIHQDEVIEEILKICKDSKIALTGDEIFSQHYLDVEPLFRKAGWKVEYDKPGYNESYEAYWRFSRKEERS